MHMYSVTSDSLLPPLGSVGILLYDTLLQLLLLNLSKSSLTHLSHDSYHLHRVIIIFDFSAVVCNVIN